LQARFPWLAVAAVVFTAVVNDTMFGVALPAFMEEFSIGARVASWGITGYIMAMVLLMMGVGRLADTCGKAPVYRVATVIFGAGSLIIAAAPTFAWVLCGRVAQGIGAAAMFPLVLALVVDHSEGLERLTYLGRCEAAIPAGALTGPLVGGFLIQFIGWRFSMGAMALIVLASAWVLRGLGSAPAEGKKVMRHPVDWWGGLGLCGLLLCLLLALTLPGARDGGAGTAVLTLAAVACLALLLYRVGTAADPFVPRRLMKDKGFCAACGAVFTIMFLGLGVTVAGPIYLGNFRGLAPAVIGLMLFPRPLGQMLTTPLGARMAGAYGYRLPVGLSLGCCAVALIAVAQGVLCGSDAVIVLGLAAMGVARGLAPAACAGAAARSIPKGDSGSGAALYSTFRYAGGLFGSATLGTVIEWRQEHWSRLASGPDISLLAYRDVFLLLAALSLAGLIFVLGLPRRGEGEKP